MDLREKMAMLRMEQGQATEHDNELIFGDLVGLSPEQDIVATEPVDPLVEEPVEKPKRKKKLEDVGKQKMENLGSPVAEKRLLMQLSKELKQVIDKLSSKEFINEIADAVIAKIDASVEG